MSLDHITPVGFEAFDLSANVQRAVLENGYTTPTPIQERTIPVILAGQDMIGQAETGSGKTAAFTLPILSQLDLKERNPQVLILTPTRELAIQVCSAVQKYGQYLPGLKVLPVYGGQSYDIQLRALKKQVHIVVGTPGRITDLIKRKVLNLSNVTSLVLDEADEMLNMGFLEDVNWIIEQTPETRQTVLFSATMPSAIRKIANQHLNDPQKVTIKNKTATASTISQHFMMVAQEHKMLALEYFLEIEEFDGCIIFARTKLMTNTLAENLREHGYRCTALNGELAQKDRERTIRQLKAGHIDIVLATDVAARGLDVERISHVINFDVPDNADTYVHRIGRTGRAGRTGAAITLINPREMRTIRQIEQHTRQQITRRALPTKQAIITKRKDSFKQKITDALARQANAQNRDLIESYCKENDVSPVDVSVALVGLLQGDKDTNKVHDFKELEAVRGGRSERGSYRNRRDKGNGRGRGRGDGQRGNGRGDRDRKRSGAKSSEGARKNTKSRTKRKAEKK